MQKTTAIQSFFILLLLCVAGLCASAQSGSFRTPAGLFTYQATDFLSRCALFQREIPVSCNYLERQAQAPEQLLPGFSLQSMALFCRMEVKMERAATFPVKFRLGTLEYVDRLEQKPFVSPR